MFVVGGVQSTHPDAPSPPVSSLPVHSATGVSASSAPSLPSIPYCPPWVFSVCVTTDDRSSKRSSTVFSDSFDDVVDLVGGSGSSRVGDGRFILPSAALKDHAMDMRLPTPMHAGTRMGGSRSPDKSARMLSAASGVL